MGYNFPAAPAIDEEVTFADGKTYTFNGDMWKAGGGAVATPDYVLKAGDTMTGALVLPADPVAPLEATTKQYVDNHARMHVSDTEPPNPMPRDLWWKSDSGDAYLRYDDGDTEQWVEFGGETETTALFDVMRRLMDGKEARLTARIDTLEARLAATETRGS